jgi:prevent-host-death family protein
MARTVRKSSVKEVPVSEIKDDLSRYLREAETQEIIITRHGKPAGVLIGFESEEDWFDYRLEHDPRFLQRIEQARNSLRAGGGIRLAAADLIGSVDKLPPDQSARKKKYLRSTGYGRKRSG